MYVLGNSSLHAIVILHTLPVLSIFLKYNRASSPYGFEKV